MYAQKADGSLMWHKYFNEQWTAPAGRQIQGPQSHYVDWGPDGVLDTNTRPGETVVKGHQINLYSAPDGIIASTVGFWKPEDGVIPMRWSATQRPVRIELTVSEASETADDLSVTFRQPRR